MKKTKGEEKFQKNPKKDLTGPTLLEMPGKSFIGGQYFDLFFTRGFSEKCYSFSVGFLFYEEGSPLPAKIF